MFCHLELKNASSDIYLEDVVERTLTKAIPSSYSCKTQGIYCQYSFIISKTSRGCCQFVYNGLAPASYIL
jgi:hypothetical protein